MKKLPIIISTLFFVGLFSCQQIADKKAEKIIELTHKIDSVEKEKTSVSVKNKDNYSPEFIEGIKGFGFKDVRLIDSLIVIDKTDSITFSRVPLQDHSFKLTSKSSHLKITVSIRRINYTSVKYSIEMEEAGKASNYESGVAHLNPGFVLGVETDESEISGLGYEVSEFNAVSNDSCFTSIRVGYEEESGSRLLGRLIKNCNGSITTKEFPMLIEK